MSRPGRQPFRLEVLFVGRVSSRRASIVGGLALSAQAIVKTLTSIGNTVRVRDVASKAVVEAGTHLVWHYGDLDNIHGYVKLCGERKIPLLVNSTFDAHGDRALGMVEYLKTWDKISPGVAHMVVFTEEARHRPEFKEYRDRVVCLPKTLRPPIEVVSYKNRAGICLGEAAKTFSKPRLTRGLDPVAAVKAIQAKFPQIELWTYAQYGVDRKYIPKGVNVQDLQPKGFHEWLGRFRLFVSLVAHETFAMVPAEAQGAGTPVLYRYMPQSLSAHLNTTGLVYSSIPELLELIDTTYGDAVMWASLHRSGVANARAHAYGNQAAALHAKLRVLVRR